MELKDTVKLMLSDNFKDHLKAEYWQTRIRLLELKEMIDKWDRGALRFIPPSPKGVYVEQMCIMSDYLTQLFYRASIENIDLTEGENQNG